MGCCLDMEANEKTLPRVVYLMWGDWMNGVDVSEKQEGRVR